MAYKKRTQGNSKPTIEGKVGADYNRDGRRWFNMEQIVDRENDRYKKRLVDEETGQVIRDDDGKLSDHQGFGDAKPRKSPLEGKEEPET